MAGQPGELVFLKSCKAAAAVPVMVRFAAVNGVYEVVIQLLSSRHLPIVNRLSSIVGFCRFPAQESRRNFRAPAANELCSGLGGGYTTTDSACRS